MMLGITFSCFFFMSLDSFFSLNKLNNLQSVYFILYWVIVLNLFDSMKHVIVTIMQKKKTTSGSGQILFNNTVFVFSMCLDMLASEIAH